MSRKVPQPSNPDLPAITFQSSKLSSVLPKEKSTARGQGLSGGNEDILERLRN